ncbi:MAG: 50S ribosomal protein L9 [candidate division WOR-3 bacterium]|jgi:large subunit ribosomal protein L9|nr:50S ribosomal protein L9 [candidate division WOR-3 bacterium]MCR4423644.1 50S ribosomal protein L9 [candidate division WOR-3 bacterium]MDH7518983.1 50S ribosomal protein L9 [bacterium]
MKVILLTDIERLGKQGEVVDVRDGFARNYLLPRKLAIIADEGNMRQLENIRQQIATRNARQTKRLMTVSEQLGLLTLKAKIRMGAEGAFGAITNADIADLLEKAGHNIDKHAIVLDEPIKAPGIYDIPIKLGHEITATVKLWVAEETVG